MTAISIERWQKAQTAEAAFHANTSVQHIARDVRNIARTLMRIDDEAIGLPVGSSVLDVGCGPHSLLLDLDTGRGLLDVATRARGLHDCVAIDPLRFDDGSELAYARSGIKRFVGAAEDYEPGEPFVHIFDEVWCYNCLQHVRDVDAVLALIAQRAVRRVRLFEWVDVAESVNHPHVLNVEQLRAPFAAWRCLSDVVGTWRAPDFVQRFAAFVVQR